MKTKNESVEMYVALFIMLMAVVNIILVITGSPKVFLKPFSIGISVFLFYLAWEKITELETYQKMKMLFFIHHLEREAVKEAKKVIKNVNEECED